MKKPLALLAAGSAMLALVGCGASDFENEADKLEAFERYVCDRDSRTSVNWGANVASGVLADRGADSRDKIIALDLMTVDEDVLELNTQRGKYTTATVSPRLDPDEDGRCYGWTWDRHIADQSEKHLEGFTYGDAVEAGVR